MEVEIMQLSAIKSRAKQLFKDKYWPAVGISLIPVVFTSFLSGIGGVVSGFAEAAKYSNADISTIAVPLFIFLGILALIEFLIKPHLQTYVASWFLSNAEGEDAKPISSVFKGGNYWRILLAKLLMNLKMLLFILPACLLLGGAEVVGLRDGSLIIDAATNSITANPAAGTPSVLFLVLAVLGIIAYIAGVVVMIRYAYSVAMVPYLICEHPYDSAKNVIKRSKSLMNGHRFEFFKFEMSYIGWFILGILTFGLGMIFYAIPYYNQGSACYYKELKLK